MGSSCTLMLLETALRKLSFKKRHHSTNQLYSLILSIHKTARFWYNQNKTGTWQNLLLVDSIVEITTAIKQELCSYQTPCSLKQKTAELVQPCSAKYNYITDWNNYKKHIEMFLRESTYSNQLKLFPKNIIYVIIKYITRNQLDSMNDLVITTLHHK